MNNNIMEIIEGIDENNLNTFIGTTSSDIVAKTDIERVINDTSWIDMIEDSIPYLDNIIRNPRRFIVQEENIVPIEKAKVVTEESIKHLAQNTRLIQDVDKDGSVIPLKLLNVYREETTDLYENRFIKSLVDNLYKFVSDKLESSDQKSFTKINNKASFNAENKSSNTNTKITVLLESNYHENKMVEKKDGHTLEERIMYIKEVIGTFMGSQFIKNLKDAEPVRSPIRKTNVILKEQNFLKALDLWEYLEKNLDKPTMQIEKETIDKSLNVKDIYELSFYLQSMAFYNNLKDDKLDNTLNSAYISKIVNNIVFENDINETEFKNILLKEFKGAKRKKLKQEKSIKKCFEDHLEYYEKRKQKAMALLR